MTADDYREFVLIFSTTELNMDVDKVYLALTGDQVAITDIHIS